VTRRHAILLALLALLDVSVVMAGFAVALAITVPEHRTQVWTTVLYTRFTFLNVVFVILHLGFWQLCLRTAGLYESYRMAGPERELRDLSVASLIAVAPVLPVGHFFDFSFATPEFVVAYFCLAFVGLSLERLGVRGIARAVRRRGRNLKSVVIVGDPEPMRDLAAQLEQAVELGYHIVESVRLTSTSADAGVRRVAQLLDVKAVNEVFVAVDLSGNTDAVREVIAACEELGIAVRVFASVAKLAWGRPVLDQLRDQPVITVASGYPGAVLYPVKRMIDILVSLPAVIILAPVLALVAVAVKVDSSGPVFFAQERVGLYRRRFRLYKFRTMVSDAEALQAELEEQNEAQGPVFKIHDDPRVTKVGALLRRFSIDELPQLLNVLKGDMSLVGPRPLPVRDVDRIVVAWHKRRFSVRPGITCLWQIRSREPIFDEWIKADMEYIDNWSLGLDLKILTATIPAVFANMGTH